jgi:peptidoglycan-associated lipoprotein
MNRWTWLMGVCAVTVGCGAAKPVVNTPTSTNETTTDVARTAQPAQPIASQNVSVSGDIARACRIMFDASAGQALDVNEAPKFDFDQNALTDGDQTVLAQVARCITDGPLKGRRIKLVGRADPRGEVEYNMVLGARRADSAERFLIQHGVDGRRMTETSRGKLDATGSDDSGWARDRRVDVDLI